MGNSRDDIPVWKHARAAITVNASRQIVRGLSKTSAAEHLTSPASTRRASGSAWIRLLRPHQWLKNALVAIPLFTAHDFTSEALLRVILAVIAFSTCASSVYILNDIVDVQLDRAHPTKRNRPLALGEVPIWTALIASPVLLIIAAVIASYVSLPFLAVLATYYGGTIAYTFLLKRKMLIDVVALSCLYTVRVIGGTVALALPFSEWLLGFSTFIFLSLALVKRHAEMALRLDQGLPDPINRNYKASDLPVIIAMATAAGYCAVIVFSLYLSSEAVRTLYTRPQLLWLVCPLLLYWISRTLMMSHRRHIQDDPVIWAISDRVSLATGVVVLVLIGLAI